MEPSTRRHAALALAFALVAGACAAPVSAPADPSIEGATAPAAASATAAAPDAGGKDGGPGSPIVLRVGTNDRRGLPGADYIAQFATELERLSGGRLTVSPELQTGENGQIGWDQRTADMVHRGDLDLAVIDTRSFDAMGVSTLRPLHAPFLLTTDEAVDAVATGDVAPALMAGLSSADFEGLALWPAGLRHPYAYGRPIRGLADFKGLRIRTGASLLSRAIYEALGATPRELANPRPSEVDATETAFSLYATIPSPGTYTANITFFPKLYALVASPEALARLSDDQQRLLRAAADATTDWAVNHRLREAEAEANVCAAGGTVVVADDRALDDLQAAVRPVYADLEVDPTTKSLIDRIRTLASSVTPPPDAIEPCGAVPDPSPTSSRTPAPTASPGLTGDPAVLNGTYRADITPELLVAAGVSRVEAHDNAGIFTLIFRDGVFTHHLNDDPNDCVGPYVVTGSRVRVSCAFRSDPTTVYDPLFEATWSLRDGQLRFTDVERRDDVLAQGMWGSVPFVALP